jgi:radical SAM enzyme (TIGR01210 family)
MIEALFQLPLIHLNLLEVVPFETGDPWSSALAAGSTLGPGATEKYALMIDTIARSALCADLARDGSFGRNLKRIRDRCRTAVIRSLGYVFDDGFGKTLARKAKVNDPLLSELTEVLADIHTPDNALMDALATWTGEVLGQVPEVAARAGRRKSIPRKKSKDTGTRFLEYRPETARLKIILPTGGCRVPTCTFCMLPSLARAKASVEQVIASAADLIARRPVRQVSVYTDGSYFDHRELTATERLSIADCAREWGANELLVESLPRFLTWAALDEVIRRLGPTCRLRIAVGVQSTSSLIRRYITGTPITQSALMSLLTLRRTAPITLRLFLLANKPMMSAAEDFLDLQQSLALLDPWLTAQDIVTINPLLPTRGTLVEQLEKAGYWRPLSLAAVEDLTRQLKAKSRRYTLEFGPTMGATCTDSNVDAEFADPFPHPLSWRTARDGAALEMFPWSLLGGYRSRYRWAQTGGYASLAIDQRSAQASDLTSEGRQRSDQVRQAAEFGVE